MAPFSAIPTAKISLDETIRAPMSISQNWRWLDQYVC
jgi:hypothetical protein